MEPDSSSAKKSKRFFRLCPTCDTHVGHTTEWVMRQAEKEGRLCCSCAKRKMWATGVGPGSAEACQKRGASIKKRRADPSSKYRDPEAIRARGAKRSALMKKPDSVFQSEGYRKRLSEGVARARAQGKIDTPEAIERRRETLIATWSDLELRRQHASILAARWEELGYYPWEFKERQAVSALELRLKPELELRGFKHSLDRDHPRIGSYTPDFVDETGKRIVEVYGDYWHCNPKHPRYGDPDFVHPELGMTSKEKWEKDAKRISYFQELGYEVNIVWESDT